MPFATCFVPSVHIVHGLGHAWMDGWMVGVVWVESLW